jgi:competence protein ComEC
MERNGLKAHFYDVPELEDKWGDCTYYEFPDGSNMLIDCGTKAAGNYIVKDLLAHGVEQIDVFVISHFHSDHIGGYAELVRSIDISQIYSSGYVTAQFMWIEEDIAARGIPYGRLVAGDSFTLGGADFEVLWPLAELVAEDPTLDASDEKCIVDTNNRSLVLRIEYGKVSLLMTADVYKQGQRDILAAYVETPEKLDADIMKIPHHGYDNAVYANFIEAVSPCYAVMQGNQVMTNVSYAIYKKMDCTAYATWMNGNVLVLTDGETLEVFADDLKINDYYK